MYLSLLLGAESMAPKHPQNVLLTFGLANQRVYLEGNHLALFVKGHSSSHKDIFIHFHLEQPVVKRYFQLLIHIFTHLFLSAPSILHKHSFTHGLTSAPVSILRSHWSPVIYYYER